MTARTLADLSKAMRGIDFAVLFTRTEGGALAGRPMSNNGQVDYDGDSHFFAYDTTRTARDIARDPGVALSYQGAAGLLGRPPVFIVIQGEASLLREREALARHWTPDLERWFPQGIDTPGLVLVRVRASRLHYWDGEDEGEVPLPA